MSMSWSKLSTIFVAVMLHVCISSGQENTKNAVVVLTEYSWSEMLEGEWLVEFYAPWCPACKSLEPTWKKVATWQDDLEIKVASVDVSDSPSLSGRFLVTALPTIYHVKDGEFRQYKGARTEESIINFVDDKKWKDENPVPWYYSPKSAHMAVMGWFFKASIAIRDVHNSMTTTYGIPTWGSYVIFAILTIVIGLILGLCIVCACDYAFPPPVTRLQEPTQYAAVTKQPQPHRENPSDDSSLFTGRVVEDDDEDDTPTVRQRTTQTKST